MELRRGSDKAELYSIAINKTTKWLACTSDKGTVHIFSLIKLGLSKTEAIASEDDQKLKNKKHTFQFMKKFSKYFDSEWSFSKFRVPDTKPLCTFDQDENLIVISAEGQYYRATFDKVNGGDCEKVSEKKILSEEKE